MVLVTRHLLSYGVDIYIAMVSHKHSVCAENYYIAFVSTTVETSTPELEIDAGLRLLGPIEEKYASFPPILLRRSPC